MSYKQLKAFLVSKVKKFDLIFLALNLDKSLLFDGFFFLDNFWPFNFPDFLANSHYYY